MSKIITALGLIISTTTLYCQNINDRSPYKVNLAVDLPASLAGTGLSLWGFYLLTEKKRSDSVTIANLNFESDVPRIDRYEMPRYSTRASTASDHVFYGSLALPLTLFIDENIRDDAWTIALLYWETMALAGTMYTLTAAAVDKYRPLVYHSEVPLDRKMRDKAKNSFYGGHPAVTATSTFFIAKVVSDYYPERKGLKRGLYATAGAVTMTMSYLRLRAGKHFLSDVAVGAVLGALNGVLIPHWHKKGKDRSYSLSFFTGDIHGLTMHYNF